MLRLLLCILGIFSVLAAANAGPLFDTGTPTGFFTNVASRLLSNQLGINLVHIQVYPTNQYTPAVHRLLQVTANILDAQNTNFYPTVFRPVFAADASSNVFIIGYQQVTGVSGQSDPQLAVPYDVSALLNSASNTVPIMDSNGPVNVYGVPWVLGAKYGLPNFNQLAMVPAAQFTRKLQVIRDSLNTATANYVTNEMYVIGISNNLGLSFWNSYQTDYIPHAGSLTVFASDTPIITLTNSANGIEYFSLVASNNLVFDFVTNSWPGSKWFGSPPTSLPQSASFFSSNLAYAVQNPLPYNLGTHTFGAAAAWSPVYQFPQLDQFGLLVTNYLQAYILDGSNVIDYVQMKSPAGAGNLNQALADPPYPQSGNVRLQWSTNTYSGTPVPWGIINQLLVSIIGPLSTTGLPGGAWSEDPTPMGDVSPAAESAYFYGLFTPSFVFGGQTYVNTQMAMQAPYTPTRTVYSSFLLQANDPLVHYLADDLNGQVGAPARWNGSVLWNGIWNQSDNPFVQPLPVPPATPIGGRYQPWGRKGQMAFFGGVVDANTYNVACKDPLVWSSDYWNFPTGQDWNLSWIGQVHRGTPWQTIYLKSTNILAQIGFLNGVETWVVWTGNDQNSPSGQRFDSAFSCPVMDWQLAGLLGAMLNTNDLNSQFSINNPTPAAWASQIDGMTAWSNSAPIAVPGMPPQLSPMVISSNSTQASIIANAILAAKTNVILFPNQTVQNIGSILATPQLTVQSPYLNLSTTQQQEYAINDQAYEAIPSQLLPLLRMDSIGQIVSKNGQLQVQFSGYDGHNYAVQISSDLLNWTGIYTNSPSNGFFNVNLSISGNPAPQFYRTVLIQ